MNAVQSRVDGNGTLYVSMAAAIPVPAPLHGLPMRAAIQRLEAAMRVHPDYLDAKDVPLKITFGPPEPIPVEAAATGRMRIKLREIFIAKGQSFVGKIHKFAHINVLIKGRVQVATEFGVEEIDASNGPVTMVSGVGTKRAGRALEDVIWMTIHLVDTDDIQGAEDYIVAKDYAEIGLADRPIYALLEGVRP